MKKVLTVVLILAMIASPYATILYAESIRVDFNELASQYGANFYNTQEDLERADLVELIARIVYGEQTKAVDRGQEAIVWTIANRMLAQRRDEFAGGLSSSLFRIVTQDGAYTALKKEGNNQNSYTTKNPYDTGWVNAVKLAYKLVQVFEHGYTVGEILTFEETKALQFELTSQIGASPIGNRMWYAAESQFMAVHTTVLATDSVRHFYNKENAVFPDESEINQIYINLGGNYFFQYIRAEDWII